MRRGKKRQREREGGRCEVVRCDKIWKIIKIEMHRTERWYDN